MISGLEEFDILPFWWPMLLTLEAVAMNNRKRIILAQVVGIEFVHQKPNSTSNGCNPNNIRSLNLNPYNTERISLKSY